MLAGIPEYHWGTGRIGWQCLLDSLYRRHLTHADYRPYPAETHLAAVLSAYYHPLYDSLLIRLWQGHHVVTPESLPLLRRHPATLSRGLLSFSLDNAHFRTGQLRWSIYADAPLMRVMLTTLQRQDTAWFRRVVQHTVQVCGHFSLDAVCCLISRSCGGPSPGYWPPCASRPTPATCLPWPCCRSKMPG